MTWVCSRGKDRHSRWLVTYNTGLGRARLAMLGGDARLLQRGRVSSHRRITVRDGTRIDLWIIHPHARQPARGTVLLVHGLWDSKALMLPIGERLARMGYHVVLPDLRSHGRSGGQYVTFGGLETTDLREVMDQLLRSGEVTGPLYVEGFSMGGGIAVQYAAADPRCQGVAALAPVASARLILHRVLRLAAPFCPEKTFRASLARAGELAGFAPDRASAIDAAGRLRCPLIVVHGRMDLTVPYAHGVKVYHAATVAKEMITVPWAGHKSLLRARSGFNARLIEKLAEMEA